MAAVITQPPGKQVLYVIWQRLDPIGEGFYALADVDFGQSVNPTDVLPASMVISPSPR